MPITFTTDFGLEDNFAGVMKGVVLGINPKDMMVDISHGIRPGDIREAMFMLETSVGYFPEGTIHVAVVDPGVGSGRRALIIRARGFHLVGPDNGIFTPFLGGAEKVISIESGKFSLPAKKKRGATLQGSTFDGRDVFAPAAAWLSRGVRAEEFGPVIKDPVLLKSPAPLLKGGRIEGIVVHVDRFGNCITDIGLALLQKLGKSGEEMKVRVKGRSLGLAEFYLAARGKGRKTRTAHAIVNSSGLLEIFVPGGSAGQMLGLSPGDRVTVL